AASRAKAAWQVWAFSHAPARARGDAPVKSRNADHATSNAPGECRGAPIPVACEQDLQFVWISTMAFVAIGVLDEGDGDAGATYFHRRRGGGRDRVVRHSVHEPCPKGLFEFVVGVGRWALRVQAYAFLLVTDRCRSRWPDLRAVRTPCERNASEVDR